MKYILHYVEKMNRGGMENFIMNIYRKIDRTKYQFHFVVHTTKEGDYDKEIQALGGKIIIFPHFRQNPLKYKAEWSNFWKENKNIYSKFHYHTNSLANITAIQMAMKNDFENIIIHAHSSYANKGKLQVIHNYVHRKHQRYIKKKNIRFVAVSDKAAKWVFGENILNNQKVNIVKNGIDYNHFTFVQDKRDKLKKDLSINDQLIVGHVGNFLKVKNHSFLIEIFKEMLKHNDNLILLLLGDGSLKDEINEKAKKLNISHKIIMLGSVRNVEDYLQVMDLFIFPSFYEGLPLALIEAQVNGIPVIYSDSISSDVIISKSCFPIPLNAETNNWSNIGLELIHKERSTGQFEIDNKFNINDTICEIIKLYNEG